MVVSAQRAFFVLPPNLPKGRALHESLQLARQVAVAVVAAEVSVALGQATLAKVTQ